MQFRLTIMQKIIVNGITTIKIFDLKNIISVMFFFSDGGKFVDISNNICYNF